MSSGGDAPSNPFLDAMDCLDDMPELQADELHDDSDNIALPRTPSFPPEFVDEEGRKTRSRSPKTRLFPSCSSEYGTSESRPSTTTSFDPEIEEQLRRSVDRWAAELYAHFEKSRNQCRRQRYDAVSESLAVGMGSCVFIWKVSE